MQALWNALLEAGKEEGIIPCGLGARDTLRLEAGMPLYGHEMDDTVSPLEIGLGFAVKMEKENFIGKEGILSRGEVKRTRVGIKMLGRGIAREKCPIYAEDQLIGETTSGTHCPFLGYPVAMAIVDSKYSSVGTKVAVEVRGKKIEAEIINLPFYKRR